MRSWWAYVDALVQGGKRQNETRALLDMVARSRIPDKAIIIADRDYESYNVFVHIENKGWNYVIRVRDSTGGGILSSLSLPKADEFDVTIRRILTRKQTKEVKARPDIYRYVAHSSPFGFLDLHTNRFYPIFFRVVCFKISDVSYETIIINVGSEFTPKDIKELYKMRWGIETSFRELKYAVGLTNFHAKSGNVLFKRFSQE